MTQPQRKPRVAVHKFSSCDGCQLALLNLGATLLDVVERVDFVHFVEMGPVDEEAEVDIAIVEGSISTPEEAQRIREVRARSKYLIAIGACATSGGIQALRNLNRAPEWTSAVYASPEYISILDKVTPISANVRVDLELWGCPVNAHQVLSAIRALLFGVVPPQNHDKLCTECKRLGVVCMMVARDLPCMGPVTQTGCGVICPRQGRDCYACYGPAENANAPSLARHLEAGGMDRADVRRRFLSINNAAPAFAVVGKNEDTEAARDRDA
ncbi:MAG TPA: sulfhydrogenase subunit delta [Rhodocyclaceae bacterium]|nr:sulfhydrogenase subunit delta [Rhodocyclaceae bacterium]HNH34596.1 sulfhydrogenase subunit delta [Rhodocyclaceae bacterium]